MQINEDRTGNNNRVLIINSVCGVGSTGRIVTDIAKQYENIGYDVRIAFGRGTPFIENKSNAIRIGGKMDFLFHVLVTRLFDAHGFASKRATKEFLKWAEEYNPTVLWLHNIHGYYINIEMLFDWIKSRPDMEVRWTLHDCWAFTGHCAHFSSAKCEEWKSCCCKCPQRNVYPQSILLDKSRQNYIRKRESFTGVKRMSIITPSEWLREKVSLSFLHDYSVNVIPNTIDGNKFKPTNSSFREDYGILRTDKMLLGVSSVWTKSKGLEDLLELSKRLDSSKYKLVIVGLTDRQIAKLPKGIIGMGRIPNDKLPEIYSAADIFINPSKEETFGLTTIEALKCGTMAIVYKDTACEEVAKSNGGIVVEQNIESLYEAVVFYS